MKHQGREGHGRQHVVLARPDHLVIGVSLDTEFASVRKESECLVIRERLHVAERPPVHDQAYRELCDLAAPRTRNIGDLEDLRGDVT